MVIYRFIRVQIYKDVSIIGEGNINKFILELQIIESDNTYKGTTSMVKDVIVRMIRESNLRSLVLVSETYRSRRSER